MQHAANHRALAEVTLDALAADLTVPHARPLVDLDRDDYADVEIDEPTATYERVELHDAPDVRDAEPTARLRKRRGWNALRISAAVVAVAAGFGLGVGFASLI